MPKWAAKAVEELLTPTYWLDPGESGEPFSATIRFSGRRTDVTGKPQPRDSFWQEETVDGIIPGSGPVAITAEVRGINPGDWTVTARSVARTGGRSYRSYPPPGHDPAGVYRVPPPRRVEIPAEAAATVHTSTLLRSKVPGVVRFAYATLVGLGVLVGLGLEALLLSHGHYSLFRPMLFSVIAIIAGVIGGKTWYVAVHRGKKFDGWCIQGFVAGAAVVVAAAALAGPGIPAGAYLAAAAPALLIGMSIGRPGCFWAGCCTGRPTAARWGVWSSDRRLGCRRAPAQLLEALSALISGGAVLIVVLVDGLARSGPVAVVGLAAYTLARQFILGLRAEPRVWPYGRRRNRRDRRPRPHRRHRPPGQVATRPLATSWVKTVVIATVTTHDHRDDKSVRGQLGGRAVRRGSGLARDPGCLRLAHLAADGRSETVRGLTVGRDERFVQIDQRATAVAGLVVLVTLIVAWLVATARGQNGHPVRLAARDQRPVVPARHRVLPLARLISVVGAPDYRAARTWSPAQCLD